MEIRKENHFTDDGLAIQGLHLLDRIPGDFPVNDVPLYSFEMNRLVRRDFAWTSHKVHCSWRSPAAINRIKSAIVDFREASGLLTNMVRAYEFPETVRSFAPVKLKIINDDLQILFDAIVEADRAITKLKNSELADLASENIAHICSMFIGVKDSANNQRFNRHSQRQSEFESG